MLQENGKSAAVEQLREDLENDIGFDLERAAPDIFSVGALLKVRLTQLLVRNVNDIIFARHIYEN